MFRFTLCGLALAMILGCTNTPKNADGSTATPTDIEKSAGPDGSDLLRTLQGKWQSERDPSYYIEFADTRMIHFNGGKVTAESDIEVDVMCQSKSVPQTVPICRRDGALQREVVRSFSVTAY